MRERKCLAGLPRSDGEIRRNYGHTLQDGYDWTFDPGDMRWRQDLRPLSCVSNYLVQLLILRWGSLRGKHQHLSIGAGIATGWPWLCLLPGFDCPSTLAMHVNSTPAIHLRRTP